MSITDFETGARGNPVDLVERLAALNDWTFERSGDSEITLSIRGRSKVEEVEIAIYKAASSGPEARLLDRVAERAKGVARSKLQMLSLLHGIVSSAVRKGRLDRKRYEHALRLLATRLDELRGWTR